MEVKILSAGIVVIRKVDDDYSYLLLRAFKHWDFPKGVVELGETPLDGACREVKEESTIEQLSFNWGYDYRETGPYGAGKIARYYIAETKQSEVSLPINPEIGIPEHDEYRWVTYDEGKLLVSARVRSVLNWAQSIIGSH